MWYEIIPPFTICTMALFLPGVVFPKYLHLWSNGNAFGRDAIRADMRPYVKRDYQLNDKNVYKFVGLEAIKDSKESK